jgi:glycosyltransferase involved in cell wall biosynthesis
MKESTPLVTVYITTFNRINLLERAVTSVRNQTYSNIEIIVADDGSTDGSREFLEEMEKKGYLKATINTSGNSKGACFGRNNAISMAKGEFITGLDDDDYFEEWRVETFITRWKALHDSNKLEGVSGLFDSVMEIRPDGKHKYNETVRSNYLQLRRRNYIGNQVFTPTKYLKEIGGFDEEMPALQDWETWLRLSKRHGELINVMQYSYIIDQSHGEVRISEKKSEKIRLAFSLLSIKLTPLTWREKVTHLESLYAYKQLGIKWSELIFLALNFKFRRVAQVLKRQSLNA